MFFIIIYRLSTILYNIVLDMVDIIKTFHMNIFLLPIMLMLNISVAKERQLTNMLIKYMIYLIIINGIFEIQ